MLMVVAVVPVAFGVALLRQRLLRGNVASLLVELGDTPLRRPLRDALARALGDPTVEIAYRLPDGRFVDRTGRAATVPGRPRGGRRRAVQRDGETIAVVLHDPALARDPALAASVGAAAGLALHNERLQAELRAPARRAGGVAQPHRGGRRRGAPAHRAQPARRRPAAAGLHRAWRSAWPRPGWPTTRRRRAAGARGAREPAEALEELRELGRGIHPPCSRSAAWRRRSASSRTARRCRSRSTCDLTGRLPGAGRGGRLLRRLRGAGERRQARRADARRGRGRPARRPARAWR